jgi:malonyl-CoA/methylmalonyl-CoA synthetase
MPGSHGHRILPSALACTPPLAVTPPPLAPRQDSCAPLRGFLSEPAFPPPGDGGPLSEYHEFVKPAELPLFERARQHGERTAILAGEGHFEYAGLIDASGRVAAHLLDGGVDLEEARVAYLLPPGFAHAAVQWGIWRAGGIGVPLALSYPARELDYVVGDSGARILMADPELASNLRAIAAARDLRLVSSGDALAGPLAPLPSLHAERRALILYTSGTTGRPKGAVLTHANIDAQVACLVSAWEWSEHDQLLHVLPLHHIHGLVNGLTCALWSGARCRFLPRFDAESVWAEFLTGKVTLFMAVPTIYVRLIAAWESSSPGRQRALSDACRSLRLMISGSAPLPVATLARWREISGHTLLERYGMTETGMILSNPLRGERLPGSVGLPLPGVDARLVDEAGAPTAPGAPGEVEVRGPGVFREYWQRPDETLSAFRDGWFRTGDVGVIENGRYLLLGRSSVDIIKTGGYKVSALEVEEALRGHPQIADCAVVGVPDPEWGERVAAAVVPASSQSPTLESLRAWASEQMAPYKIPSRLLLLNELPRNAMGKVAKPELARLFPREC